MTQADQASRGISWSLRAPEFARDLGAQFDIVARRADGAAVGVTCFDRYEARRKLKTVKRYLALVPSQSA